MSVQHDNEEHILSSLYGMTLAGLRGMQKKVSNASIQHLILRAIELKESPSEEAAATCPSKPRGVKKRQAL